MTSKQYVKLIVDTILNDRCLDLPERPYQQYDLCERRKYRIVTRQLNQFVARFGPYALNECVLTRVPRQGRTDITILEAAIVMRDPLLVSTILSLGASPCVTTSGVPLLEQMLDGRAIDSRFGLDDEDNQIIDILLYYNAQWCPNYGPYYKYRPFQGQGPVPGLGQGFGPVPGPNQFQGQGPYQQAQGFGPVPGSQSLGQGSGRPYGQSADFGPNQFQGQGPYQQAQNFRIQGTEGNNE